MFIVISRTHLFLLTLTFFSLFCWVISLVSQAPFWKTYGESDSQKNKKKKKKTKWWRGVPFLGYVRSETWSKTQKEWGWNAEGLYSHSWQHSEIQLPNCHFASQTVIDRLLMWYPTTPFPLSFFVFEVTFWAAVSGTQHCPPVSSAADWSPIHNLSLIE